MPVQTQLQTRRGTAASWTSTNPTLAAGEFGYETDTGKYKIGNGSTAWAALAYTAAATAVTYLFNATSGQTTFSGADANGLTLAYTVGAEQVYLNGVLQVRGSDYTGTNGTSIVLASGALTSDVLNIIAYSSMTVTDTYTQAQSDARFVQQSNNFFAGKNKIINGDFGIWQRGNSFTTSSAYSADRWLWDWAGTGTTTVSRQTFTPGAAPVAGYEGQNFWQIALSSGASYMSASQRIEDVRTFAGQTVTFSFWARATSSITFLPYFRQSFGSGGSADVDTIGSGITFTSSWTRYTSTVTLPSISGKTIGTSSYLQPIFVGSSGTFASNTVSIWGVQLEAGSIATPFQTATGTIAGELAACQRYYYRTNGGGAYYPLTTGGFTNSTTTILAVVPFPVSMRIAPTALEQSGTAANYGINESGGGFTCTGVPQFNAANPNQGAVQMVASGLTIGRGAWGRNDNNTTAFLAWSAEL